MTCSDRRPFGLKFNSRLRRLISNSRRRNCSSFSWIIVQPRLEANRPHEAAIIDVRGVGMHAESASSSRWKHVPALTAFHFPRRRAYGGLLQARAALGAALTSLA